ncbi:hypothetical protein [Leptospira stimsonii]|uniref:Uncharacterized protein n=1 Tax=Leptospira stimsonii TaxID=2202203 RepID=A0A8B3CKP5_9LEPT|nr:hypothetical protein [Leptospira stimsonii]RHX83555.1 hypothetical protein DLM78_21425 [Leptospira stimsonii]
MNDNKGFLNSISQLFQSIRDLFPEIRLRHFAYTVIFLFLMCVAGLFIFESVSGYFYFNRVENRVNNIKVLSSIDSNRINSDPELNKLYQQTITELQTYQIRSISSIPFEIQSSIFSDQDLWSNILKFITGASLWIIILMIALFSEDQENRIAMVTFIAFIGALFGYIGIQITSISPWVNYIGYPFGQLLVILLIAGVVSLFKKVRKSNS